MVSRPVLSQSSKILGRRHQARRLVPAFTRPYHSYEHSQPFPPFNDAETAILSASMLHVPVHGFSSTSMSLGARDAGYLDVSTNLFPKGVWELVRFHLITQRLALKNRLPEIRGKLDAEASTGHGRGVAAKVRLLCLERLMANRPVIGRWQDVSNPHNKLVDAFCGAGMLSICSPCPLLLTLPFDPS